MLIIYEHRTFKPTEALIVILNYSLETLLYNMLEYFIVTTIRYVYNTVCNDYLLLQAIVTYRY